MDVFPELQLSYVLARPCRGVVADLPPAARKSPPTLLYAEPRRLTRGVLPTREGFRSRGFLSVVLQMGIHSDEQNQNSKCDREGV